MDMKHFRDDPEAWRILEERARGLLIQEASETELGEEIVTFQLGDGAFSIPAHCIREVQRLGDVTPLPGTPPFVVGLVNVRSRLHVALDIRPLLDIPQRPPQADAFLLVLAANGMEVGLLADVVVEVRRSDDELTPVFSAITGRGIAWVRGVDRRLNLWLDPAALLSDPQLIVNGASSSSRNVYAER